jgi:glucose/arabinose dehydrogenase
VGSRVVRRQGGWLVRLAALVVLVVFNLVAACRSGGTLPVARPEGSPSFMPLDEPDRPFTIRNAFPHLRFQNPVFAVMLPRTSPGRWLVGEREGRILSVEDREDARDKRTVLDLRAHTLGWQDCGLLNLVFHPEFGQPGSPNRGYFYVWYNHTDRPPRGPEQPFLGHPNSNRLSRFTIPDGATAADPASELVLIDQPRSNTDHQGGGMFFHPEDGFLYLAVGDGGHPLTESRGYFWIGVADDAQRIDRDLLSGLLRIDVDRRGGKISHPIRRQPRQGRTQGYFIPGDNPWLDPAGGQLEEFFAIGLRNPHRASYDPLTRRIFVGDVGDRRVEEVNVVERGGNYQWSFLEGSDPTRFPRPAQVRGREQGPLFTFTHQTSGSVIGGLVYRGRAFPELTGRYLFGDNGSGQIWSLPGQASAPAPVEPLVRLPIEMTVYAGLSSFAVDDEGEPYFCVLGDNNRGTGTVQKLVRAPRADRPAPATLSATGLFTDLTRLAPAGALFPYEVNAPFWSDHAEKARWLFVPPGTRVGFRAEGDWTFPPGTIAVKHFDLPIDERDPTRRRRLETRVLVLDRSGGVYGRTYKWRPDGRDADLVTAPVIERLTRTSGRPAGPWQLAAIAGGAKGSSSGGADGRLQLESPPGGIVFAQAAEAGDFDLAASFSDVAGGSAGLMVRRGPTAEAPYLHAAWEPQRPRHLRVERRERAGGPVALKHLEVAGGPWIRTQRARGALTVFAGEDGHLWQEVATFAEGEGTVQVGLAARASAAGPARAVATAAIRCEVRDHLYPGAGDCAACHSASAGHVLGVSTRQWNREVPGAGGRVNQLLLAQQRGLLDGPLDPARLAGYRKLVSIDDPSASVEDRVRSYLDVNCSQCHRPGNVAQVAFDARYDTPLAKQALVDAPVRWPNVTHVADRMIHAKSPDRSRIYAFMSRRLMPPVGNLLVHEPALDLLRTWILDLPGPPALVNVTIRRTTASPPGRPVEVTLSHPDPEATIRYTIDGSGPGPDTLRYDRPFRVPPSTMVRAAAFREGFVPSKLSSLEVR